MSEITLTGWDVLDEARAGLRATVAGVPADGWRRTTPCTEWNALQVLQQAPAVGAIDGTRRRASLHIGQMPNEFEALRFSAR